MNDDRESANHTRIRFRDFSFCDFHTGCVSGRNPAVIVVLGAPFVFRLFGASAGDYLFRACAGENGTYDDGSDRCRVLRSCCVLGFGCRCPYAACRREVSDCKRFDHRDLEITRRHSWESK